MEVAQLVDAIAEARGEALRLREFAFQRQTEAVERARIVCSRLVGFFKYFKAANTFC
jgi:hypothetical protein